MKIENPEKEFIEKCKKLIETKLNWQPSENWKQRDYEFLSDLIEQKSKVRLSLSTMKRIWNPNFDSIPHLTTLDALAIFLDYSDWCDFKIKNIILNEEKHSENQIRNKIFRKNKVLTISIFFLFLLMIFFLIFHLSKSKVKKENFIIRLSDSLFWEVPQTVKFSYKIIDTTLAEYFIQTETESNTKNRISKSDTVFEFYYNVPGINSVKIFENDSVIKEAVIKIFTEKWIAFSQYQDKDRTSTIYLGEDFLDNGVMNISSEFLIEKKAEINKNQFVTYYYINDFKGLNSDNFIFETKLKSENLAEVDFPDIFISFVCSKTFNFIPLTSEGNKYGVVIKYGENKFHASEFKMEKLACNPLEWQTVKIIAQNNNLQIYRNGEEAFSNCYFGKSGDFYGFIIYFVNTGSIDYVRLSDINGKLVYSNEFD